MPNLYSINGKLSSKEEYEAWKHPQPKKKEKVEKPSIIKKVKDKITKPAVK